MTGDYEHRRGLTFGQAEGVSPLPAQLTLGQISKELRARLWSVLYSSISYETVKPGYQLHWEYTSLWKEWLADWWVYDQFEPVDQIPDAQEFLDIVKMIILKENYIFIFNFVQFIAQKAGPDDPLTVDMRKALEEARSAYRLVDDLVVPVSSSEQAAAITESVKIARMADAQGPYSHLKGAASALSAGNWGLAVQESIHAVEGAAKSVEPTSKTLGPALDKLQETANLPPALKRAFSALYGWTSDSKGVRHALVFEGKSGMSERDALFMFGACASFVGYLLSANE